MNQSILTAEVAALLVEIVIFFAVIFETKTRSKKSKVFLELTVAAFTTITLDVLSYLPINWGAYPRIMFLHEYLVFIFPFITYGVFLYYMNCHLSEKVKVRNRFTVIGIAICALGIVCTTCYSLNERLFKIIDGIYYQGDYLERYLMLYVIALIYIIMVIVFYSKKLGPHDSIACSLFMVVPIIFIIINLCYPKLTFSIASIALSNLIIYIMLQSEQYSKSMEREQESHKLAHYDELTGLQNRLASSEFIENLKCDSEIGVVFGDLNGLKYTNDTFGHKAGDKLLCDFADLLVTTFRKDDVFRISGDEFIVLLPHMPYEVFEIKKRKLIEKLGIMEYPIASLGFEYGMEAEVHHLIEMAEKEMYEDKKQFYKRYPMYAQRKKEDVK